MIEIIYEDRDILVCIKPAGTLSEKSEDIKSLPRMIEEEYAEKNQKLGLFVVHRLDREVCGVILYAKTQRSAAKLSAIVANREFQKEYLAVVEGELEASEGELCDLLFRDAKKNKSYVVDRKRGGVKEALLKYKTLERRNGTSLLKIKLHTGRTHQIRVQFASRKHPIVGDRKYGSATQSSAIALCSHKIAFNHPSSGTPLCFTYLPQMPEIWNIYDSVLQNIAKTLDK